MIYPSLNLDARLYLNDAGGKPALANFTRASSASHVDAAGRLATAASGMLRHDFAPQDGEYLGWLIEEQRSNLLLHSEQFSTAAWNCIYATVAANAATAPDGSGSADILAENGSSGVHILFQSAAGNPALPHSWSLFAKAGGSPRRFILDLDDQTGNGVRASFDPSTGTVTGITGTGAFSNPAASIKAHGNGWYRCAVSGIANSGGGSAVRGVLRLLNGAGAESYAGDGASSVLIWGAQLEAGSLPSSYIATAGSQATRAADLLTVPTSAFAYNQAEGTLLARFDASATAVVPAVLYSDGSNFTAFDVTSPYKARAYVMAAGLPAAIMPAGSFAANTATGAALAYKANDFALAVDGATPVGDSSGALPPAASSLHIGAFNGASLLNGHIRHIAYFPRRLANAELQDITR